MANRVPMLMTGGASGIGHATAEMLAERGHSVVCLDIKPPRAPVSDYIACDLNDPLSIDSALGKLKGPYSALLNIAGVPDTQGADVTMRVNIFGLRKLTEGVWDRLADGAQVVNIASIAGNNWRKRRAALAAVLATPDFDSGVAWWQANAASVGVDAYTFSKEAVVLYTMQLAGRGLARRIRVNDIGPGPIDTPIFPDFERMTGKPMMDSYVAMVGRLGRPQDIAEAVVTLAEGQMGWLNGQHIVVDGGLTAGFSSGWKAGS